MLDNSRSCWLSRRSGQPTRNLNTGAGRLERGDSRQKRAKGFTLIELIAFMVVVSIALLALVGVFQRAAINNVDPIVQTRALECAQAKLDEILARKFADNTPTGGVPACGSADSGPVACTAIQGFATDPSLNDVGDFDGQTDTTKANCSISVEVVDDGTAIGLGSDAHARRINVTATSDGGGSASLSAYKVNF